MSQFMDRILTDTSVRDGKCVWTSTPIRMRREKHRLLLYFPIFVRNYLGRSEISSVPPIGTSQQSNLGSIIPPPVPRSLSPHRNGHQHTAVFCHRKTTNCTEIYDCFSSPLVDSLDLLQLEAELLRRFKRLNVSENRTLRPPLLWYHAKYACIRLLKQA